MRAILLSLCLLAAPATAQQVIEWNNTQGGQWHVPANWSPADVPGDGVLDEEAAKFALFGTRTVELPSFRFELAGLEISNGNYTFSTVGASFGEIDVEGDTTVSQGVAQLKRATPGAHDTALYTGGLSVSAGATLSLHDGAGLFGDSVQIGNHATKPTELAFYDNAQADLGSVTIGVATAIGREALFSVYNNASVEADAVNISPTGIAGQEGVLQVIGGHFTANEEIAVGPATAGATGLLAVSGGGTIAAKKTVTVGPTGTVRNLGGLIDFQQNLVINGGKYVENSDEATWQWRQGRGLEVQQGEVSLMQPAATLPLIDLIDSSLTSTGSVEFSGSFSVLSNAHLSADGGSTVPSQSRITFYEGVSRVDGPVTVAASGAIVATRSDITFGGPVVLSGGLLLEDSSVVFESDFMGRGDRFLVGPPTGAAIAEFRGEVSNGEDQMGQIYTVAKTIQLADTATLRLQLTSSPFAIYDRIAVEQIELGGALVVSMPTIVQPFPRGNEVYTIVEAVGENPEITGSFDTLDLPPLPPDLFWRIEYENTSVRLRITQQLPGDYNGDGIVDAADYTVWRDSLGRVWPGLAADGTGDGRVDGDDLTFWRERFGNTAGGVAPLAAAVPEPDAVLLAMVVLIAAHFSHFRRYLIVRSGAPV